MDVHLEQLKTPTQCNKTIVVSDNFIQMNKGCKSYGIKQLFSDASFSINRDEHVGVIGPNGAGKTTLFKILTGQEELDDGELVQARGLRIGYLAQHDHWDENQTVEDYLSHGCHMPIWELKSLGRDLGLDDTIFERPIASLSGGYRMRCKLLHLLGEEPDLLLLDEPTNYLDLESVLALEKFLQNYGGSFLLISHDREFLRRTTDHILEIEAGDITKYNGSLDDYFEQKALLRSQLEARALSVEQKRQEILDFVARFGAKASKARQAQSRLKGLDKLEKVEIKDLPQRAVIRLPEPVRTGKQILTMTDVDLGYGKNIVLKGISFSLDRGHHLAVVGVNGAGKSTFLKSLAGKLEPLSGELKQGFEVTTGYYAQHVSEALDPDHTVFEAMGEKAHPSVKPQQILNLAGSLLFSGDNIYKKISVLSGGEKSRVALGQILLQKAPCLILDEPTNHLDFDTVEALTQALVKYEGTVVVVSHDRSFIGRIGNKVLEIRDGQVAYYPGTYEEYVWSCQKGSLASRNASAQKTKTTANTIVKTLIKEAKVNFKEEKKNLERELRKIEKDIAELEEKLGWLEHRVKTLHDKLTSEPTSQELNSWITELAGLQKDVKATEEQWILLGERKEEFKKKIAELFNK